MNISITLTNMTTPNTQMSEWEKEFDEKFKCIQSDCDGNGIIPSPVDTPNGTEWEAQQCQFHAEYLFPIKSFISQLLTHQKEELVKKATKLFEDADEREDRVELSDVLSIINKEV